MLKLPYHEFEKRLESDNLFFQLVQFGRLAAKAWWLERGRIAAKSGAPSQAFNFWYANMRNRFGWADKAEVLDDRKIENKSSQELKDEMTRLAHKIKGKPANVEMNTLLNEIP